MRNSFFANSEKTIDNFIKSELSGDENVENLIVVMVAQLYEYTESHWVVQLYEFTKSQWVIQFNGWIL